MDSTFFRVAAFARYRLATAHWASLNIATNNMILILYHSAIAARSLVGAPIVQLATVPDALEGAAFDVVVRLPLRLDDAVGPTLDH
jgi:hypothetical protein